MNLYSLDKLAVFAVGLSKIFQYDHFPDIIAGFMVILKSATIIQYTIKGRFMSR
ncbi:MAG: hypothetical protein SOT90_06520 [Muribaculaceae bacterium]|nr:hypothetical protein [Muribaculaceae bacterium]